MIFPRDVRALAFAALLPLISTGALRADEPAGVACQGRILPASRILKIAAYSETGAPVVAKLVVAEGAEVKAGDMIAELTSLPGARARTAEAQAGVNAAAAAVKAAGAAARAAIAEAELEIASAQAALETAGIGNSRRRVSDAQLRELRIAVSAKDAELTRLRDSRPAFVARADAGVAAAQANADAASGRETDVAAAELVRAKAARELAMKDYDARLAGETDNLAMLRARLAQGQDLNALPQVPDAELAAAQRRRTLADTRLNETRTRTDADIARAEAEAASADARLAQAKASLAAASVRAPISGRILKVNARAGEAVGPDGVVEMGDLSKLIVLAEVSAADLPRTRVGEKAKIRVPGLEKAISGTVSGIGALIGPNALAEENPSAFRDLRVAPVEISIGDPKPVAGLIRAQVSVRLAP